MKQNHMFDVAFTLESEKNWEDVTDQEKLEALEKRVKFLKENPEEIAGAFGYSDSYECECECECECEYE